MDGRAARPLASIPLVMRAVSMASIFSTIMLMDSSTEKRLPVV
jgi:hypothetical protein